MLTELTFGRQPNTFLNRVEAARLADPAPDWHQFVAWTDATGAIWQGEAFVRGLTAAALLQRARSGGDRGIHLTAVGPSPLDAIQLLVESFSVPEQGEGEPANATVEFVRASQTVPGVWRFDVTLAHPDTGWEDYTDGWQVLATDGRVLGTRILLHPHETEQPFTRSLGGVAILEDVSEVLIQAHDLVSGYGGRSVLIPLVQAGSGPGYEVVR